MLKSTHKYSQILSLETLGL